MYNTVYSEKVKGFLFKKADDGTRTHENLLGKEEQ